MTFSYNPAGQINQRTNANTAFTFVQPAGYTETYAANGLNQYTSAGGVTPTYDGRGNMTNDGTKTYSYEADNRMITAGTATLAHDPAGRLYSLVTGATSEFIYEGDEVIGEYLSSPYPFRRFIRGPGADEVIMWYDGTGTTQRRPPCLPCGR